MRFLIVPFRHRSGRPAEACPLADGGNGTVKRWSVPVKRLPSPRLLTALTADVRKIESLESFHGSLVAYHATLNRTAGELKFMVRRVERHFAEDQPEYWRHQCRLAERALTEARDNFSRKRAAVRVEDRPAATEAAQRVKTCEARLSLCEDRLRRCKRWKIEIKQQVDRMLGPIADLVQHGEVFLPAAAQELSEMIDQLKRYADS